MYKKYIFVIFGFSYVFANQKVQELIDKNTYEESSLEEHADEDFLSCALLNKQHNQFKSYEKDSCQDEELTNLILNEYSLLKQEGFYYRDIKYFQVLYQDKLETAEFQELKEHFKKLNRIQKKQLVQIVRLKNIQLKKSLSWFSFYHQETIIPINECIALINRVKTNEDFKEEFKEETLELREYLISKYDTVWEDLTKIKLRSKKKKDKVFNIILNQFDKFDTMEKIQWLNKYHSAKQVKTNFLECITNFFCEDPCCFE